MKSRGFFVVINACPIAGGTVNLCASIFHLDANLLAIYEKREGEILNVLVQFF